MGVTAIGAITALLNLNQAGFPVGKDRVQRIWRRAGLKVPQRQKPRGRLWLNDRSCVRLRPGPAPPCGPIGPLRARRTNRAGIAL